MVTIIDSDESDDEPEQLQYKVIILGDGAVGKTSLSLRFTGDYCSTSYKQTIGVDFFLKQMVLPGDLHVAVQLWDIGGQTIGGKMIGNYIYGAQAVLLTYDITNYQSFVNLEDWLALVEQTFGHENMPYAAVVANKEDLSNLRAVSSKMHESFAREHNLHSFSVSAKTGNGVAVAFLKVAAELAGVILKQEDIEAAAGRRAQQGRETANPLAEHPPSSSSRPPAEPGTRSTQEKKPSETASGLAMRSSMASRIFGMRTKSTQRAPQAKKSCGIM
mmetsp:Transcript_11238/g.31873  ORF Transcript_11238/g.31873 Transcript_11238/m.31873 type:complete len:274 (+) Transcript_11238:369-1190(+)